MINHFYSKTDLRSCKKVKTLCLHVRVMELLIFKRITDLILKNIDIGALFACICGCLKSVAHL